MNKPVNKFSLKATIFVSSKSFHEVDGPWKPTVREAIVAFRDMLEKRGWLEKLMFKAFVAKRCLKDIAPCRDGHGNYYTEVKVEGLDKKLEDVGIRIGELHRRSLVA